MTHDAQPPPRPLWSQRADAVRSLPLEPLAERLGYRRDPGNRQRWKGEGSVLAINADLFYDHVRGHGGQGAIDLVLHARGGTFAEALAFLEGSMPPLPPPPPAPPPRPARQLPPPPPRLWHSVLTYLVSARGLAPSRLTRLLHAGQLYPDPRQNAVFPCRPFHPPDAPPPPPTGAEIVGTRPNPQGRTFKSMAPGSNQQLGGFWLPPDHLSPSAILLVESAVDALSVLQLMPPELPARTLIASTAGLATRLPAWLDRLSIPLLICGYDADSAGDLAFQALRRHQPACQRLRPFPAKDWNELLLLHRSHCPR